MPNGQGTLAWQNLNDLASWFIDDFDLSETFRQIGAAQQVYQSTGVYVSDDAGSRPIKLAAHYYEGPGTKLGAALATLSQTGEQYLTFDNKVTAIQVKYKAFSSRKLINRSSPYLWSGDLEFIGVRNPYFADLTASTVAGFAVAGTTGGSTTNQNVTYAGSVFTRPVWTFAVTNANPATISSLVLKNNMSGEALTVNFPGNLAASTAWTVTIDCGAWSVSDQNGQGYDVVGSWPMLYGPAGTVQQMAVTVTTGTGTLSNATMSASYQNRWSI